MRKKLRIYGIAILAAVCVAGSSLAEAAMITAQEKKLIRAAKKEGGVVIINPLFSDRTSKVMGPAFAKRYGLGSGFKFRNLRKGTGSTVAQVRQEIKAGKFTVDVHLVSAPGFFHAAVKRGAFLKLDSGNWKTSSASWRRPASTTTIPTSLRRWPTASSPSGTFPARA